MINLRKINKFYHTEAISLHALKDIDLDIESGEYVAIMGASGWKIHVIKHNRYFGQLRFG